MRSAIGIGFLAALSIVLVSLAFATDVEKQKPKALCPVMGEPINQSISIDYHGAKLYFCCNSCIQKFKTKVSKYAARANLQLVATGQARQTACPLTGGKTNPSQKLKVGGVDVLFCCAACPKKVAKLNAAEQLETVFGKGFKKAFVVDKVEKK